MDSNDHLSIKNLLFTKAIPNYVIPVPTAGHIVYACTDCGDKFLFSSSYDHHINRKSVKISYFCRHCNVLKVFYNRCNLLSHIRFHAFKTATINVSDLKLDPLPMNFYTKAKNKRILPTSKASSSTTIEKTSKEGNESSNRCFECNVVLNVSQDGTETLEEKRVKHFTEHGASVLSGTYTCPMCLFSFFSKCALMSHLRFHFKLSPYFCPDCGRKLANKNTNYPYEHDCESFMMMRSTARLKCPVAECHLLHPSHFKDHIKENHLKKVYKCPFCYLACCDEEILVRHLKTHTDMNRKVQFSFYQCELCPGKLILCNQMENHLKDHLNDCDHNFMYPCWVCAKIFKDLLSLSAHHMVAHFMRDTIKECYQNLLKIRNTQKKCTKKKIYRVVKKCDQCKRSFFYNCKFEQINTLPNECPYQCTTSSGPVSTALPENELLTCHMCKNKISQDWDEIKKHFNEFHKTHRCLDLQVTIPRINIEKHLRVKQIEKTLKNPIKKRYTKKKLHKKQVTDQINNNKEETSISNASEFICKICLHECTDKTGLQEHLPIHRDPCMAYQCLECGQNFVVKPSFSKHLLLEHNITNVDTYISEKPCYNENALMKYQEQSVVNEPLCENQCKICRDQFVTSEELEKHFRVHGMAFLMKNNSNKSSSP